MIFSHISRQKVVSSRSRNNAQDNDITPSALAMATTVEIEVSIILVDHKVERN